MQRCTTPPPPTARVHTPASTPTVHAAQAFPKACTHSKRVSPTSVMADLEGDALEGELRSTKRARADAQPIQHEYHLPVLPVLQRLPPHKQAAEAELWEELVLNSLLELAQLHERGNASPEHLERAARIQELCVTAIDPPNLT